MREEIEKILEDGLCGDIGEGTKKHLAQELIEYIEAKIEIAIEEKGWATMDTRCK